MQGNGRVFLILFSSRKANALHQTAFKNKKIQGKVRKAGAMPLKTLSIKEFELRKGVQADT